MAFRALQIGLVFETFETYPRRSGEPADAHDEYEPESTVAVLEAAIEGLGHRPVRLGCPHDLLATLAGGALWKYTVIVRACHQQGFALPRLPQRGSGSRAAPERYGFR